MDLPEAAARALDAASAAGADDAEAFAQDATGREIRVFDGEVESLTDGGERGVGVRSWIGGRGGHAARSDLSAQGGAGPAPWPGGPRPGPQTRSPRPACRIPTSLPPRRRQTAQNRPRSPASSTRRSPA